MFCAKCREVAIRQGAFRIAPPRGVRGKQQREFAFVERAEVHLIAIQRTQRSDFGIGQQASLNQRRRIDQIRITGERREALVGRVAVASRAQRTDLPIFETRVGEEPEKCTGRRIKGADAIRAGERSRMHQQSRGPMIKPVEERSRRCRAR
jgi:hypothetical protein